MHLFRKMEIMGIPSQGALWRKTFSLLWILLVLTMNADGKKKSPPCNVCTEIVTNFKKGLDTTSKSNYGGGNTKWEEKSLGSYATSEVRFVEIVEHLCENASKECHSMLERHEEDLERYWFKEFGQKKDTDLQQYLCIEHIKACCPSNTFGPECSQCPGAVDRPCSGNGKCDGEGTREGTGKCKCDSGYRGDICDECKDGYFEETKNDTHTLCKVCHISCKNTCWEGGPKGCDECKAGWTTNEELGCQDINECSEEPCDDHQYCTNTQGSYTCFTCDDACVSCTRGGPAACTECASGYVLNEETKMCTDVNECENDLTLCTGDHQECENKPGSYQCVCMSGFALKDGKCQSVPKDDEDVKEDGGAEDSTEGSEPTESKTSDKEEL